MPITTTVTTSTSGASTTVDVRVDDDGPGGGDRYVEIVLSFDPAKLEFASSPSGATEIDAGRMLVWWHELLRGTGNVTRTATVEPRGGIPFLGSSTAKAIALDPVDSDMAAQLFYVGGGPVPKKKLIDLGLKPFVMKPEKIKKTKPAPKRKPAPKKKPTRANR